MAAERKTLMDHDLVRIVELDLVEPGELTDEEREIADLPEVKAILQRLREYSRKDQFQPNELYEGNQLGSFDRPNQFPVEKFEVGDYHCNVGTAEWIEGKCNINLGAYLKSQPIDRKIIAADLNINLGNFKYRSLSKPT